MMPNKFPLSKSKVDELIKTHYDAMNNAKVSVVILHALNIILDLPWDKIDQAKSNYTLKNGAYLEVEVFSMYPENVPISIYVGKLDSEIENEGNIAIFYANTGCMVDGDRINLQYFQQLLNNLFHSQIIEIITYCNSKQISAKYIFPIETNKYDEYDYVNFTFSNLFQIGKRKRKFRVYEPWIK